MNKSYMAKKSDVTRAYYVADARDKVTGRLATAIATVLSGKHKPTYTPHVDCGDYVIILNADKVRFTGKKETAKTYQSYSGYPGGLKRTSVSTMRHKKPTFVLREAVRKMLPKNKLGSRMLKKLRVYASTDTPAVPKKSMQLPV